ncbi:unnamed protein product [Brachionus calyciflorus]|uniref:Peptidase M3A/M3B catalytic domain-containing protein n=1 Tax=Brachionus calyciflorus TaxID=104777 RepID=A0A813M718_9BILA|nr:unnamed protein product [Brachionus calyciflorus]
MGDSILKWDVTSDKIKAMSQNLIDDSRKKCEEIIKSNPSNSQILKDLNELERNLGNGYCYINILKSVFPDKEIRDTSKDCVADLNKLSIELKMNKALYDFFESARSALDGNLDTESQRYLDKNILERRLDGLHLDEQTRNKVKEINEKISDLCVEFSKNCNEESTKLIFTKEQLDGVSENLLKSLPKDTDDNFIVSLKYPVYFPVMKECRVPETRRKLVIAFDSRCVKENTKIFEQILQLRKELANVLGFKTFSEYKLKLLCAENPENVDNFLNKLADKMKILQRKEMDSLLEYKRKECEELSLPFDGKINPSDLKYYLNLREQKEFRVNHSKLQEYFPLSVVIDGTFKIYQQLLNLKFEEVHDAPKYHEELKLYKVTDNLTNETIGYFYTDLHPRDGKYGHAAVFGLRKGTRLGNQIPVCIMVCNFTKATEDQPSLLTHDEVETFFHEFGHVMHQICTKANFYKFGGTSVERDFVEAPSQMLENWCWQKESLKILSSHYKDGSNIDDQLIDDLIKSKNSANGCFNMRQILFAKMDQFFHTTGYDSNTAEVYKKFCKEYMLQDLEAEGLNMNAAFEHLTGGYEAQYYSYLWSEVYSEDMFQTRFKGEGILNGQTGLDYRKCILEPGGSIDAKKMVTNFLGRAPTEEAFLKAKGADF